LFSALDSLIAGIDSGLFVHATLSALGVSMLLMHSATAFHFVKLAGACYLAWLGLPSLRSAVRTPHPPNHLEEVEPTHRRALQQCFLEGLLSNVFNPKTAVFYLAFLPQFIGPMEPALTKSLLLEGIHYVEGILWLAALSIMLDHIRRFLLKSMIHRWLDGLCGAMLIGFRAHLAFEHQ
jgi:threonine/homoserine/homoserine lactone efflux protein